MPPGKKMNEMKKKRRRKRINEEKSLQNKTKVILLCRTQSVYHLTFILIS
jgi:hypothetical protein